MKKENLGFTEDELGFTEDEQEFNIADEDTDPDYDGVPEWTE